MHTYYKIFISLLLILLSSCKPKPEDFVKEAKVALKNENTAQAIEYFQQAYELSLPESYFVTNRNESYQYLTISVDRNWLLLINQKNNRYHFLLKDLLHGKVWKNDIPRSIDFARISPRGKFILFSTKKAKASDLCSLLTWDRKKDLYFKVPLEIKCTHKSDLSDQGKLVYMKDGKIGLFDIYTNKNIFPYMQKIPDKPFASLPSWAYFSFNRSNVPFMTYGSAGNYKLYNLKNHDLLVLTRAASYGMIHYMNNSNDLGLITGGAGNRKVFFYDPDIKLKVKTHFPIRKWEEVSFINNKQYYFIEGSILYKYENGDTQELPFWAKQIHVGSKGELYFLSSSGAAMVYSGEIPKAKSKTIFEQGWDLYESQ